MMKICAVRKAVVVFVLSLALIFLSSPCFADFRFVVMGDSRGSDDGINSKVFRAILRRVSSENPKFILFTGDMTAGSKHGNVLRRRLLRWKGMAEGFGIPVYTITGNHEISSESSEDIVRAVFKMPENGPAGFKRLTYSFNYRKAHFVALDTDAYKDFHRIGAVQMEWLRKDLKENKSKFVFIAGHEPAYPVRPHVGSSLDRYPSERDELWDIFRKYGIAVYFCGHEHLYKKAMYHGVYQIITGGAGAHLHSSAKDGGFYHYIVVDVGDDGGCGITVKDADGRTRDTLTITVGNE